MNLEQMKLAQSLGVKAQAADGGGWVDGDDWEFSYGPGHYRIAPGQTFDGGVAAKLKEAEVELEWRGEGERWYFQRQRIRTPKAGDGLTYRIPESFGVLEEKVEAKPTVFVVARGYHSEHPTLKEAEDEAARLVAEYDGKATVIEGRPVSEWVCDATRRAL